MPQIHRLYIPDVNMHVDCIDVTGADAKIVSQVLRLQEGDRLTVLDGRGQVIETQIQNKVTKAVKLKKINQQMLPKLSPSIQVSIGALKGDKSTWVLQKLTEIGVQRITFFDGDHSVAKTDKKKKTKYETTCVEALRQSGNPYLPEVDFYNSLSGCLDAHKDADIKICLHEKEASSHLSECADKKSLSFHVMIGPEGGFSEDEIHTMQNAGYQIVRCAPYVLRAETAAIYGASFLRAMWN